MDNTMNKAEICGSNGHALAIVVDPKTTLRFVRKPDGQPCCLTVWTSTEGTLVVEIDGEKASAHKLLAKTANRFPLSALLPARSKLLAFVKPLALRAGKSTKPRSEPEEFTVFIHRGDEDGMLLGTYSFKLMSAASFDEQFERCAERDARNEPTTFTTDARSPETAHKCWNCQKPLSAGACCQTCGCEKDEPESE
jgi:hypothetical protein